MGQTTSLLSDLSRGRFAPKYVNVAQKLLHHIANEQLRPGDRLGTEVQLARAHDVSRVTVRQALAMLEEDGYISREKARGTFVRRAVDRVPQTGLARGTVVVICSNEQAKHADEDFAFATVLRAMERTLAKQGFAVQILGIGEDDETDTQRLRGLTRGEYLEGICTIGPCLEPYAGLVSDVPVVASCSFYSGAFPLVGQDVRAVCRESIDYLLSYGHQEIAVVCGPWVDRKAFAIFGEGYREAFESVGLRCRRSLLYHAYPGESLTRLASDVLTREVRPTAVFAENWRVCEALLAASAEQGLRIPDDLSLVGYGQNVLLLSSPVALTAYVPDSASIGEKAADLLVRIIDGASVSQEPVAFSGRLIERDSVRRIGPPAGEESKE